ncbi:MAG: hypothetical protein K0S80_1382 [Neobacillus sp.]|nr:hypothetical protein [Neobacillus sp.]
MPTADKADKVIQFVDAMEKQDKDEMMDLVRELQASDLVALARVAPMLRTRLRALTGVEIELIREPESGDEALGEEELKELSDKYGERAKTPHEGYIKYEGPQQLLDMIMKNKEKKGWKFKDEQ